MKAQLDAKHKNANTSSFIATSTHRLPDHRRVLRAPRHKSKGGAASSFFVLLAGTEPHGFSMGAGPEGCEG